MPIITAQSMQENKTKMVDLIKSQLFALVTELDGLANVLFLEKLQKATKVEVTWRDDRRCGVKLTVDGSVHTYYISDVIQKKK